MLYTQLHSQGFVQSTHGRRSKARDLGSLEMWNSEFLQCTWMLQTLRNHLLLSFIYLLVLGFELRAYNLRYSISPFFVIFFSRWGLLNYLLGLALNLDPLDLCFLSSYDYRHEPQVPGIFCYYLQYNRFMSYPAYSSKFYLDEFYNLTIIFLKLIPNFKFLAELS
jgi:hypothetical protein